MIFRGLDEKRDWQFGAGKQNYVDKNKAIGLNIKTRILSWVGDCFFNQAAGIDWNNRLGTLGQRRLLEADLRRIILKSEGVTGINSIDIVVNGRDFSASYSVNTVYSKEYRDSLTVGV